MNQGTLKVQNQCLLQTLPFNKRKISAFILYIQSRKYDLQQNNPAWGMRDIVSYVGKEWNSMSEE